MKSCLLVGGWEKPKFSCDTWRRREYYHAARPVKSRHVSKFSCDTGRRREYHHAARPVKSRRVSRAGKRGSGEAEGRAVALVTSQRAGVHSQEATVPGSTTGFARAGAYLFRAPGEGAGSGACPQCLPIPYGRSITQQCFEEADQGQLEQGVRKTKGGSGVVPVPTWATASVANPQHAVSRWVRE